MTEGPDEIRTVTVVNKAIIVLTRPLEQSEAKASCSSIGDLLHLMTPLARGASSVDPLEKMIDAAAAALHGQKKTPLYAAAALNRGVKPGEAVLELNFGG